MSKSERNSATEIWTHILYDSTVQCFNHYTTATPSPSSSGGIITGWLHYIDANKTHWEKAKWKLCKNAAYCLEQIMEAMPYKMVAVWSPTSHLTNHPSKNKLISNVLLWIPAYEHTTVYRLPKTYIVCADTRLSLEDLLGAMDDRDRWWESVIELYAVGMTWWWINVLYENILHLLPSIQY